MQQQNQPPPSPEQLQYQWPPNLTTYEARLWGDITSQQGILVVLGFILPLALLREMPLVGFGLGVVLGALVFMSFKKVGRWGGISFPMYVWLRIRNLLRREAEIMELPLIVGTSQSRVEVLNWDGETLLTVDEE